jgi:hypothetical protein
MRDLPVFLLVCTNSVVGIATSYGLDDRGVEVRVPVGSKTRQIFIGRRSANKRRRDKIKHTFYTSSSHLRKSQGIRDN